MTGVDVAEAAPSRTRAAPLPAALRPVALLRRNLDVYRRHPLILATGVVEPFLYLLGLGLGVGALVGDVRSDGGSVVPYAEFVGPALVAAAVMNGAIIDTTFAVLFRLRYGRIYDSVLASPLAPRDIAAGEMLWALVRATVYGGSFLVVLAVAGYLASPWAVLALPAAILVAWSFAGLGLALVTFITSWNDSDLVQAALLPVLLFSATFFPASTYPEDVRWVVNLSPLYHGVSLVRSLCLGEFGDPTALMVHVVVLLGLGAAGLVICERRLARMLLH
jgi:lipooligosaccharide transport system permease protein